MGARDLLARGGFDFDPETVELDDADVLESLEPAVREWWVEQFGEYAPENGGFFTPPQKEAIPLVRDRENALVASPTGSGKTLASFTAILNELFAREREAEDGLENSVYCLYVSPLKSLANDIHRNLAVPLQGIAAKMDGDPTVRHAIRHGDTDSADRQRMLDETPHILNTTPETLAILLNSPKFKKKLETVEYVVVDEIHSLADGKRGTHLAVSLERLENMVESSPTRIGCSATVEPLDDIAEFLVGCEPTGDEAAASSPVGGDSVGGDPATEEPITDDLTTEEPSATPRSGGRTRLAARKCEIVDTRFVREFDIELQCPTDDLVHTPREVVNERFYDQLHDLIRDHTNTLVFTNTRSGAERVLHNLRERYDGYDEDN